MKVNLFLVLVFGILAISMSYAQMAPMPTVIEKVNAIVPLSGAISTNGHEINVVLDGIDPKTHNAIITVYGSGGDILYTDEIGEGKSVSKSMDGADVIITVHKTADITWIGSPPPPPWANITLAVTATTAYVGGMIFDGQAPIYVQFQDFEVGTGDAILFVNSMCVPPGYEKVKEGGSITRNFGGCGYRKISVPQISPAAGFNWVDPSSGYNWYRSRAKIKIEPANSGTNFDTYNLSIMNSEPFVYDLGGYITQIRLDDIEIETRSAIISLLDENNDTLSQEKIKEGQTLVRAGNGGYRFKIKVVQVAAGAGMPAGFSNNGVWVKFNITPDVTDAESPSCVMPDCQLVMLNGDIGRGPLTLVLNNFEQDTRKAIVVLYDGADNIGNETIAEGQTIVKNTSAGKYSIKLVSAATGYSYGYTYNENATWAKFELKPSTAAVTAGINYLPVFQGGVIISDDSNIVAQLYGMEPTSHDATLYIYDNRGAPLLISVDKVKAGGTVVRRVGSQNYQIKVYSSSPAYYPNAVPGWAKMSIVTTTAAESLNYSVTGPVILDPILCQSGLLYVGVNGVEPNTRKPVITLYNLSHDVVYQDKLTIGSLFTFRDFVYGNCSIKVVQVADDPGYPPGIWAKMVVN